MGWEDKEPMNTCRTRPLLAASVTRGLCYTRTRVELELSKCRAAVERHLLDEDEARNVSFRRGTKHEH